MPPRHVSPSIRLTAFSCLHCGTLTTQTWYTPFGKEREKDADGVFIPDDSNYKDLEQDHEIPRDVKTRVAKHFDELLMPPEKRAAIEQRDQKKR